MSNLELEQKISAMERALERERKARKSAEDILRQKAMEVFEVNQRLELSSERLRLSLWASNEVVWEWNSREDMFRLYAAVSESEVKVQERGSLEEAIMSLQPEYQAQFRENWAAHERSETKNFSLKALRLSGSKGEYRWTQMRGRITKRDKDGKAMQFVGLFRDIHNRELQKQTYQTIVDAFLQSTRPGFIINLKTMHIECNDFCLKLIGIDKTNVNQEDVRSTLPINDVLESIKLQNSKFVANISLPEVGTKEVGFYLSEIPNMTLPNPHCVAFFNPDLLKE